MKVQRLITTAYAKKSRNKSKLLLLFSLVLILVFNLLAELQRKELIEGGLPNMHRCTILPPTCRPTSPSPTLFQEGSSGVSQHRGQPWSPPREKREGSWHKKALLKGLRISLIKKLLPTGRYLQHICRAESAAKTL